MSPSQCRAARGLLNWSQETLAGSASVSVTTLRNFERGATAPMTKNLAAIRAALEAAGVQFIPENGGGAGVRLRDPQRREPGE
jgi:transcriptional regulator with XRE-family HTH domain